MGTNDRHGPVERPGAEPGRFGAASPAAPGTRPLDGWNHAPRGRNDAPHRGTPFEPFMVLLLAVACVAACLLLLGGFEAPGAPPF